MHIDPSQSPALFKLASERLHSTYRHDWGHKCLSVISPAGVIAQALFTEICPGVKCELSVWAEKSRGLAGRVFIRSIFDIAFHQWDCKRLYSVTRESNTAAVQALLDMGFLFEAPLKCWYGDEEGWMFRMLKHECRWLKGKSHE